MVSAKRMLVSDMDHVSKQTGPPFWGAQHARFGYHEAGTVALLQGLENQPEGLPLAWADSAVGASDA